MNRSFSTPLQLPSLMHFRAIILIGLIYAILTKNAFGKVAEHFSGIWEGQSYEFQVQRPVPHILEIVGSWGATQYEIDAHARVQAVGGIIGEFGVHLDFASRPHHMRGWLPCGLMRLHWSEQARLLDGELCEEPVRLEIPDGWQARDTGISLALQKLAESFPTPVRSAVAYFLLATLHPPMD